MNLKAGTDYTIEIYNDADKTQNNFSGYFGLLSEGKGYDSPTPSPPAAVTTTTATTNAPLSTAKALESMAASLSVEASKSVEQATKTASTAVKATTNAAAKIGSGMVVLAGVGAVVVGVL